MNCIHRADCPKPDVCAEAGHCTSMTRTDVELERAAREALNDNRPEIINPLESAAARYEWLRDNWGTLVTHTNPIYGAPRIVTEIYADAGFVKLYAIDPQTLDQAIDAAMAREDQRSANAPLSNDQRNVPAFPCQNDTSCGDLMPGLTKRELFAAMAMQGILANDDCSSAEWIAKEAVKSADALLAALKETP